jgi:hypothetical protein
MASWRNKLIIGKSWYALSPVLNPLLTKIGALFLFNRYQSMRSISTFFDDIICEYLLEVRHVQIRSIQRSHLGQALVRFRFAFHRDNLVALGP